jgi:GNAT superfamily N-acetyltransferase
LGIVGFVPSLTSTRIRPMLAADIPAATQVILDGGWGDRSPFFRWAVDHPTAHPLVADEDGRVVGTGVATANGGVGWVGAIFVDVERRRGGLGTALSAAVIDALERAGCTTQLLIATDEGRPIYERLGFTYQAGYVRLVAPERAPPGVDGLVRPYEPTDFAQIAALDAAATGEDRSALLRTFADPATSRVVSDSDGSVAGFLVRSPWGGRALIARTPDAGVALLDWRRATTEGRQVQIALLEPNSEGRARLAEAGWAEQPGAPRFIRGEPVEWRPEWIYGQFGGALG